MMELVIMAVLVETLVQIVKAVYEEGRINTNVVISIVVGLVLAFSFSMDIFAVLGFTAGIPLVGTIATGLIISRGGNFVHDLFNRLGSDYKEEA